MTLHFDNILDQNNIRVIAQSYGFSTPPNLEKFIMDFELYYHISQKMECIMRGGMCMPFHTNERVHRLSIDIDLITSNTVDETEQIMQKVASTITELKFIKKNPKQRYPIANLLSYDVNYQSCFNVPDNVKVDFLCDVNIDLPTKSIPSGFNVLGFSIDFSLAVLSYGALIGDKLTTLAIDKIGLPERKFGDIPKQIYDIATLLKTANREELETAFDIFNKFTDYKVQIYEHEPQYQVKEIVDSINDSMYGFLDCESTVTLTSVSDGRYNSFKNRFLGTAGEQYKKTEHITNLLIVFLFSKLVSKNLDDDISSKDAAARIIEHIGEISRLQSLDEQELRRLAREDILQDFPSLPFNKNILNGPPIEQIYLVKEIFSL